LSARGRAQAETLRDRLARTGELAGATALYASVLPRATETAAIISPALGDLPVTSDCRLCEIHAGEAEGLSWADYDERFAGFDPAVERERVLSPGADSIDAFVERVRAALDEMADRHPDGTVVIACHGGVIRCALEVLSGIRFGDAVGNVENTSLTEWIRDSAGRWWLARLNDAGHLI
jgi:probable phosphoglycerate mutase